MREFSSTMHMRRNPNKDIRIKFTFSALQVYFELADEYESVAHAGVLFAAFAQHIDLYRVLDQREMYIISTEGNFEGGDFNTEIERATGAAFAATSIQDVVDWGKGWRKAGRLIGDLYVIEVDGFGKVFSHLNPPESMGVDVSGLRDALTEYLKGRISIEEGVEMSGILDREYSIPRSEICTTGLGCSIALKEWDTFKVYKVGKRSRVEEIDGIPDDVDFPVQRIRYAIADPDAQTLDDLMYDGVWGRGVYVTNNMSDALLDAERQGLAVFEVGLTLPDEQWSVFEISKHKNADLGNLGSSLKEGMDGSLNAFVVRVRRKGRSGYVKDYFVSQTPLNHTMLKSKVQQRTLVNRALKANDIHCGAQGHISIESWLRAVEYGDEWCEDYEDMVSRYGDSAVEIIRQDYYGLLREAAGLPSSAEDALRLSSTSKLGAILKRNRYLGARSRLGSSFDNYLCIFNPRDVRSWVTVDLEN